MTTTSDDEARPTGRLDTPQPDTPQSAEQRSGLRPLLLRLHFYAGVFVGPFILIAAVTGLLYVLIPQIDSMVHSHETTVDRVGEQRLPLADQLDAAGAAHPEGAVESIRPPTAPDETTQVRLAVDDVPEGYTRTVFVDPYTAEVRGALSTYGQWMPLRAWFDELHRNLHLGAVGRNYSELAASWLWVIALAGLVLWISHRRRTNRVRRVAAPDRAVAGRRRNLSWHGAVGVWIVVVLLGLSASGITWSRYGGESVTTLRQHLDATEPSVNTSLTSASSPHTSLIGGADVALHAAQTAGLSAPIRMYPPAGTGHGWHVAENKRNWPTSFDAIAVDPGSGTVTDRVDFADWPFLAKLSKWIIAAHMGILFGIANQIVLALTAVGLIMLIARGYLMWWQRRPTRGSAWTMGKPPLRGVIRNLSPLSMTVLIVCAVTIGWLLPLFGISLVAFLLVDAGVAALKRRRVQATVQSTMGKPANASDGY